MINSIWFIFSLCQSWILSFLKYGSTHNLQDRDIYDTIDADSARRIGEDVERNWNNELRKSRIEHRKPNLKKTLIYTYGSSYLTFGVYLFLQSLFIRVLHPLLLAEYIRYFNKVNPSERAMVYYFAVLIIFLALINSLIYHHSFIGCARIGTRAKIACCCLIQKKVLNLSQHSLNRITPSKLVRLISDDVQNFESAAPYLQYLYISPIQFLISTYVCFHIIGVASFIGMLFMLLVMIPQGYISVVIKEVHCQLSVVMDDRLKIMKEILYGIRVIKMYGCEKPFSKMMEKVRLHEMNVISRKIFIKCCSVSSLMFTQSIGTFLTLTTHVLIGNQIGADLVFAVALIFYNLQQYTGFFFPEATERYLEVKAAITRIENFLTMQEKREQINVISCSKDYKKPGTITIVNANAKYDNQPVLNNINLKIKTGRCWCIFGPSGSGKTSLIQMILKELPSSSGRVDVVGNISYSSQKPWLLLSSVKTNILFGQPYNRLRYKEILKLCALEVDLKKLPHGDQTLINDKIGEDIGFKEKINIARTLYKDADIYIFDNSFGNIDFQTEKSIFSDCILKYLKDKTRIFVSSKLYYAREAGMIGILEKGAITKIIETQDLTETDYEYLSKTLYLEENNFSHVDVLDKMEEMHQIPTNDTEQSDIEKLTLKRGYLITLRDFFKLNGKNRCIEIIVIVFIITQLVSCLSDYWLTQWTFQKEPNNFSTIIPIKLKNKTSSFNKMYHTIINDVINGLQKSNTTSESNVPLAFEEPNFFIYWQAGFIICCIFITVIRTLLYHTVCMKASRVLLNNMFEHVLYSPIQFFDNFPLGNILHTFFKEIVVIYNLPSKNLAAWQAYTALFGTTILMLFVAPATFPLLILIIVVMYYLLSIFLTTARGLRTLEKTAQLPIYSFLSSSIHGVFTIRSAAAEDFITELFENLLDKCTGIKVISLWGNEYFSFYMDLLTISFMGFTAFFAVFIKIDGLDHPEYAGLGVVQGLILSELLHLGIRESINTLCDNSSINRVLNFNKLPTENVDLCTFIPKNWPFCGKIIFKNVYIKDNDSPLKNLNIVIRPAEKIAVVSRLPEEKWTIVKCLLRLAPIEGLLIVDDVDTSGISLNKLRSAISVITKDPILFSASVRFNLDPLGLVNDEMLWKVLEEVGLKTCIESLSQPIIECGSNFNSGQRQLLSLARAILRHNKVVIIENNPSKMNPSTEKLFQKIIKDKFRNCTVVTIANNLRSIMENDKILVIEEGKGVEYAQPYELLQNNEGFLSHIIKDCEPTVKEQLKRIARDSFESKNLKIEFKFK